MRTHLTVGFMATLRFPRGIEGCAAVVVKELQLAHFAGGGQQDQGSRVAAPG